MELRVKIFSVLSAHEGERVITGLSEVLNPHDDLVLRMRFQRRSNPSHAGTATASEGRGISARGLPCKLVSLPGISRLNVLFGVFQL
jgi:hypothetical protein